MMFVVAVFCAGAALTILGIVLNASSLSSLSAGLLSVLVVVLCGIALAAKESALKKGVSPIAKGLTWLIAIVIFAVAAKPYVNLWGATHGFWPVTFLVWLALLALMVVWIPAQGGEEK